MTPYKYTYDAGYEERSRDALEAALYRTPAYRGWQKYDIGGGDINARYAALPELTKAMMRAAFPAGLTVGGRDWKNALETGEAEYTFTSGTTDERVINLWSPKWWSEAEAASWKLNSHLAELSYPCRQAKLASSRNIGVGCDEDLPYSSRLFGDTLYLNEKPDLLQWQARHYRRMAAELQEFAPEVIEANPSYLARLADWAYDNGVALYSPKVIVFTYEYPSQLSLRAVRRVFTSPFVSSFGTTETGFVLESCEDGLLHQNCGFVRLDFCPLRAEYGGPELGRVLVTTFGNPWCSILRFDSGDIVRLAPGCACGRPGLTASAVEGRISALTFSAGGQPVTTRAVDERLAQIGWLRDYSLHQRAAGRYRLTAVAEPSRSFDDSARCELTDAVAALYGVKDHEAVEIVSAGELYPGTSGKFVRTACDGAGISGGWRRFFE